MQYKNICTTQLYVKTIGKQVQPNEEFESEKSGEIETFINDNKLVIIQEKEPITYNKYKQKKKTIKKKDETKIDSENESETNKEMEDE